MSPEVGRQRSDGMGTMGRRWGTVVPPRFATAGKPWPRQRRTLPRVTITGEDSILPVCVQGLRLPVFGSAFGNRKPLRYSPPPQRSEAAEPLATSRAVGRSTLARTPRQKSLQEERSLMAACRWVPSIAILVFPQGNSGANFAPETSCPADRRLQPSRVLCPVPAVFPVAQRRPDAFLGDV